MVVRIRLGCPARRGGTGGLPLGSSFVWRNEVSEVFVETVAAPLVRAGRHRHAGAKTSGCVRWARPSGASIRVCCIVRHSW